MYLRPDEVARVLEKRVSSWMQSHKKHTVIAVAIIMSMLIARLEWVAWR